ncbi:MAG: hypothetical protein MPJ79_06380 [Alphaproteobacteria bacterium]|nr:hypothetical protein [Alphaproteobacteria bacterium]
MRPPPIPQHPPEKTPPAWRICRKLLFLLPPETAHRISLALLSLLGHRRD